MNTKKTTKYLIFISAIVLLTLIPLISVSLGFKTEPRYEGERKIGFRFKKNFPFRHELLRLHLDMRSEIFKAHPLPYKYIEGKDGFKFLGNSYYNATAVGLNAQILSTEQLNSLSEILLSNKHMVEKSGGSYYFAMAPLKSTTYPEKFPLKALERVSRKQQIDSLCTAIGVSFIDLGKHFKNNKKNIRIYHKTDSHWNDIGSLLAHQSIVERLKEDFPGHDIKRYDFDEVTIDTIPVALGDINRFALLPLGEDLIRIQFKDAPKFNELEHTLNSSTLPDDYLKKPSHKYSSDYNDLKVVCFHDSFMPGVSLFLRGAFKESVFLWDYRLNAELILNERPDIVIQEAAELEIVDLIEVNQ
ncbi:MAG: hypothetical protein WBA16_10075 [Nonlabens sp.]